ncbi:MAG: glycosyltransferase [Pirellulaceae bacterium]|nr:glycosyltransferase [Pirellulaceae bacterium]
MNHEFRVLNVINSVAPVNYGIWNAALSTAAPLHLDFGIKSFLFASGPSTWKNIDYSLENACIKTSPKWTDLTAFLAANELSSKCTIIASHGCWSFPSRWSARLSKHGYRWIACPHGMLEPWSLNQRRIRKCLYFLLREKRALQKASLIRAVSSTERENLQRLFPKVVVKLIPNGIDTSNVAAEMVGKPSLRRILFLGRLHAKKCPTELTQAFCQSQLANSMDYELVLAGPDQGEQDHIEKLIASNECTNIRVLGPIYGEAKQTLIESATYFALPSHSEGFPTSVIEAMGAGCIPLISQGCNFPEAQQAGLSFDTGTTVASIQATLSKIFRLSPEEISAKGMACSNFVRAHYTVQDIARNFANACERL